MGQRSLWELGECLTLVNCCFAWFNVVLLGHLIGGVADWTGGILAPGLHRPCEQSRCGCVSAANAPPRIEHLADPWGSL